MKLEAPKINLPKPEPKPEVKPIEMEAKVSAAGDEAGEAGDYSGAAAQGCVDGGCSGAGAAAARIDGAGASGRDVRSDAERECNATGNGGGDRQSLWRDERGGDGPTRRGGLDGDRQRNPVWIERRAWWAGWRPPESPERQERAIPMAAAHVASAGIPGMQKAAVATPAADAVPPLHATLKYFQSRRCSTPRRHGNSECRATWYCG